MNLKQNLQIICKISRLFYDFYYDLQILAGQGLAGLGIAIKVKVNLHMKKC